MSQERTKREQKLVEHISTLSDVDLRNFLKRYNQAPGPITESTRNLYRKKLASLMLEASGDDGNARLMEHVPEAKEEELQYNSRSIRTGGEDDDETSDEDYVVQDEDETEEDEDEESSDDEDDLKEELEEIKNADRTIGSDNLTASMIADPDAVPNRISKGIVISIISFFVAIFSLYVYSSTSINLPPSDQMKVLSRQILILGIFGLLCYGIHRVFRYFRHIQHKEMEKVCELVDEALELLQSPDNPTGMMPILHVRDTLMTPTERKSRKMKALWAKAVNFIEEHESRVKVELVNIDGEDFRAWKWIGSKRS